MAADHFSRQAAGYAQFRPDYPEALFSWLSDRAAAHEQAWDVGCGNGQAINFDFDSIIIQTSDNR